jgi:glycosyltransferase involved in cell wall biosynthesis
MKYLHVIPSVDPSLGGPIEGVIQLGRQMGLAGHSVSVVSCDDPAAPHVAASPLDVIALGPSRGGTYAYTPRLIPWLRAHAAEYQAVVINGLWQFHSFAAFLALRPLGIPYLVFTHGMLDPWFKRAYPLKHLKKWLYWPWAEHRVLAHAHAVLFTSEEERRLARESFWLYRVTERVVAYGTATPPGSDDQAVQDAQREAFLARFPELRGRRLILLLARIHAKKGADLLLRAFARCRAVDPLLQLVMAGPDQVGLRRELERLAAELGIAERVTWTGMLVGELKWGAYRCAEAYALPSHQENFGISVAEALACSLPTLISDKVNIWREIAEDRAGLVAADDADGAHRLLSAWLALPEAERQAMRERAGACFRRRFEISRVAAGLHDTLRDAIAAATARGAALPAVG